MKGSTPHVDPLLRVARRARLAIPSAVALGPQLRPLLPYKRFAFFIQK